MRCCENKWHRLSCAARRVFRLSCDLVRATLKVFAGKARVMVVVMTMMTMMFLFVLCCVCFVVFVFALFVVLVFVCGFGGFSFVVGRHVQRRLCDRQTSHMSTRESIGVN